MIIAVFSLRRSTASVPWGSGRCGAAEFRVLDVAVDAMAAERVEHERVQVQVQVQVQVRMPLLPPVLRGFGGRLAHRVLHGVDVLFGHRALRALSSAATAAFRRCGR